MVKFLFFTAGAVLGGLLGATVVLLLTPVSGENLRAQANERVAMIQNEAKEAAAQRRAELEKHLAELRTPKN
jgi:gas vesicle protein